jgi:Zn-dependent protease
VETAAVFSGEPDRTPADVNFALFGFPVRVHPMFWLFMLLLGPMEATLAPMLAWVLAAFLSVLVHELGHAFAMRYYGYTPYIVLYMFGGAAYYGPSYSNRGLRPVPQIVISLAGPATQIAMAYVLVAGLLAAGHGDKVIWPLPWPLKFVPIIGGFDVPYVELALNFYCVFSVLWGIFNLLPVFPLDGGQIARAGLTMWNPYNGLRQSLVLSMLVAVGVAVYAAVQWHSIWITVFLGVMAFENYMLLQALGSRGRWH